MVAPICRAAGRLVARYISMRFQISDPNYKLAFPSVQDDGRSNTMRPVRTICEYKIYTNPINAPQTSHKETDPQRRPLLRGARY